MQKMTEAQKEKWADLKQKKALALNAIYYKTGLIYSAPGTGVWRFLHCFKKSSPEVQKAYEGAEHELWQLAEALERIATKRIPTAADRQAAAEALVAYRSRGRKA